MHFLLLLTSLCISVNSTPTEEIFLGLKHGLQKNGTPGICLNTYPALVSSINSFKSSRTSNLHTQLQATSKVTNSFNTFVSVCDFEQLANKIFGIYQWSVLQPILIILASNLTLFIDLVNYLMLAIRNGFYYNIGLYLGELIQLIFSFSI